MAEPSIGHNWILYGDGKNSQTNWKRSKLLAKGGFGKVYLVESSEVRNVAAKQCNLNDDSDEREFGKIEWTILKELIHKRIVQYYGYSRTEHTLSLFIAYMEKGSLTNYIKQQQERRLTEEKTALFTYQILEGVVFLHSKNIIHRDIKGSNILLEDEDNVKLADFGLSKMLENVSRATTAYVGTFNWMAPERFQKVVKYKNNVDVWSVGCTVFQMITGEKPFHELDHEKFMNSANNGLLKVAGPEHSSPLLKDFVRQACEIDPEKRPSAESLIKHTFLSGYEIPEDVEEADTPDMKIDQPDNITRKNEKKTIKNTDVELPVLNPSTFYHSSSVDIDGPRGQRAGQVKKQDRPLKGKLNPDDERKIRENWTYLLEQLDAAKISQIMFEKYIISYNDLEEVNVGKTREKRTKKFLHILYNAGPGEAFNAFIESLNQTFYQHVAEKLINT